MSSEVLTSTRAMSEYFEKVVAASGDARAAANWVMGDLSALLKEAGKEIEDSPISAGHLGQLIGLIASGKINGKLAKDIFPKMAAANEAPEVIMQREGLESISDEGALGKIIDEVIAANPKQVEQYKATGNRVRFLVGPVMKASQPRSGRSSGGQPHVQREAVGAARHLLFADFFLQVCFSFNLDRRVRSRHYHGPAC